MTRFLTLSLLSASFEGKINKKFRLENKLILTHEFCIAILIRKFPKLLFKIAIQELICQIDALLGQNGSLIFPSKGMLVHEETNHALIMLMKKKSSLCA